MARIIQRCFLIFAFTGIFLSAQEVTPYNTTDSTISTGQPLTSAPENSSYAFENTSIYPYSTINYSISEINSSNSSPASESSNSTTSETPNGGNETSSMDFTNAVHNIMDNVNQSDNSFTTSSSNLSHSEGLFQFEHLIQPNSSDSYKALLESSNISGKVLKINSNENVKVERDVKGSGSLSYSIGNKTLEVDELKNSSASVIAESEITTKDLETLMTAEMKSKNGTEDFGQSSVPSTEVVDNSSYLGSNQTSESVYETTTNKIQMIDFVNDTKSSTWKRSLNTTVVLSSGMSGPVSPTGLEPTIHSQALKAEVENINDNAVKNSIQKNLTVNVPSYHSDERESTASQKDIKVSSSTLDYGNTYTSNSTHQSEKLVELLLKTSPSSIDVAQKLSIALSTASGESIHNSQHLANADHLLSYISTAEPHRPHIELEDESLESTSHAIVKDDALFTFDPDGMTSNYTQDPDSVTFTPEVFHIDRMSTNGFLAKMRTSEQTSDNMTVGSETAKEVDAETQSISSQVERTNSSERERESIPSGQSKFPHEILDAEERHDRMKNRQQRPMKDEFANNVTPNPKITESVKSIKSDFDNSEVMLNDAPQFAHFQSTILPTTAKDNVLNKNLNINVSNDISSTTGSNSHYIPKTANELDFSVYQTEQSAIRPVTIAKPSESSTLLPSNIEVELLSPSEVPKSKQSETILPDVSSPVILPNPAPSVSDQSAETTTYLQPVSVPEMNLTKFITDSEIDTNMSSNSTIAGVAVKTSVSVSLPVSVSTENTSSTQEHGKDTANVSSESSATFPIPVPVNNGSEAGQLKTSQPEPPTTSTTISSRPRIRKPKLRLTGNDEQTGPRTRKPFLISLQRPTSTSGPPVSIFKKARTRIASITSSTTPRPFPQFSTIRIHYAKGIPGMVPDEFLVSTEPITTTIPTTTETEEPFFYEPFTDQTEVPNITNEDNVTLIKVAGTIVFDKGLRWSEQLNNRHSPQYKVKADFVHVQLERFYRTSPIGQHLWKIEIDGFSGKRNSRSVVVDYFLYLVKSKEDIPIDHLKTIFHEKLKNNTFSRFTVDTKQTSFEFLTEEPLRTPPPPSDDDQKEPVIPQWAIAVIVVGAASLIFIILFATVAILGRHHVRRRYSNKLDEEDSDRPSDWESKMAAAYENLAADTIYDAEDLRTDTYKKSYNSTYPGRPTRPPRRADSWSSCDWSPPPRRPRPQVHRIAF